MLAGSSLSQISRDSGQQQYDEVNAVKQTCDESAIGRCDEIMQFSTPLSHLQCDQNHARSVRYEENVDKTPPPSLDPKNNHLETEKPRLAPAKRTGGAEPTLGEPSPDPPCEVISPKSRKTESSCLLSATCKNADKLTKAHRTSLTAVSPCEPVKLTGNIKSDCREQPGSVAECNRHCDKNDKSCCNKGTDDLHMYQPTGEPLLNTLANSNEAPKLAITHHFDRNCLTCKQSLNLEPYVAKADNVHASRRHEEVEVEQCEMFKHTKIRMQMNSKKQTACTKCEVENVDELVAKFGTDCRSQQLQEAVENVDENGKRTPQISRDKLSPNVVASAEKSPPPIEKKSSRIRGIRSASHDAVGRMLSVYDKNASVSEKGPDSGSAGVNQLPLNDIKSLRQTDAVAEIDVTSVNSSSAAARNKPCEFVRGSTEAVVIGDQTNEFREPRQVNRTKVTEPSPGSVIEPVQFWVSASSSSIEQSLPDEQLDVVEQLIEDFDSRCSALSSKHISRDFGESANQLLKLFDSINKHFLQRFASRRRTHARPILHEDHQCPHDINVLVVSTQQQQQDSDTCTAGPNDCCDNRSRELLDDIIEKFSEMKANVERFEDLIANAGRLVRMTMKATDVSRKLSSSISLVSKVSETYLNNPVERLDTLMERVTGALSRSAANVVKDQSTDIELNVDNMTANGARSCAAEEGGISVRNTQFKNDYTEVMNQCYSFEETIDRLTDVVSTAPEFLEYHSVQCRLDAVRDKRGAAEQLNANRWTLAAVTKFNEVNEELHVAMLNLRHVAKKIDILNDACGAENIHVHMRQAQLLLDTTIEKKREVDDLMTEGQCLLASLSDDQSQCLSAKIGNTIDSFRKIEGELLLKIRKFKKTLEESGLNFADYGDFSFLAWKQRFARFMTRKELQLLDVLRNHMNSDDRQVDVGVVTRRGFVSAFLATGFHTTQQELYSAFDVINATCTVQITGQQVIDAVSLPDETKAHLPAIALSPFDEHIQKLIEEQLALCRCPKRFKITHVENALYKFGDRRYGNAVKAFGCSALIRVGSGWMSLAAFLDSVDPCRAKQRTVGDGSQSQTNGGSLVKGLSTRSSSGNFLKADTSMTSSIKRETTSVNKRLKTNSLRKDSAKMTSVPTEKEH